MAAHLQLLGDSLAVIGGALQQQVSTYYLNFTVKIIQGIDFGEVFLYVTLRFNLRVI